jgi:hypothetical protein
MLYSKSTLFGLTRGSHHVLLGIVRSLAPIWAQLQAQMRADDIP